MHGVEKHLSSPIEKTRTLGMFVGEKLMNRLNDFLVNKNDDDNKQLKFDVKSRKEIVFFRRKFIDFLFLKYEETNDVKLLEQLLNRPKQVATNLERLNREIDDINKLSDLNLNSGNDERKMKQKKKVEEKIVVKNELLRVEIKQTNQDSDDDEDDGLIQYDLSNDKPKNEAKQPVFLRDCLEGKQFS